MKQRAHSDDELKAAGGHVKYEIEMLIYAAEHLDGFHSSPASPPQGSEKDMALECFLLHYRNLRAFLCPKLQSFCDDDVVASDFLREETARNIGNPELLAADKERLDKMLAHISYSRQGYTVSGNKGWRVAEMTVAILGEINAFLERLDSTERSWFLSAEVIVDAIDRAKELMLVLGESAVFSTASQPRVTIKNL